MEDNTTTKNFKKKDREFNVIKMSLLFIKLIEYLIIKISRQFDDVYYLIQYSDCRLADVDPLWHYVTYGWKEGRKPSQRFDAEINVLDANSNMSPLGRHIIKNIITKFKKILVYRIGIRFYLLLPARLRKYALSLAYSRFSFLFSDTPDYQFWLNSVRSAQLRFSNLVDIDDVDTFARPSGKIAIHMHIFYFDLLEEMLEYTRNIPFDYDLFITSPYDIDYNLIRNKVNATKVYTLRVENKGKNIAPLFCYLSKMLKDYKYIAHFHTKKSLYNRGATAGWREYLMDALIGSSIIVRKIITLFEQDHTIGIIYPQNYVLLPSAANTWLANYELGRFWCERLGLEFPRGYFDYPAGVMFWARLDALQPLFEAGWTLEDFPEEKGQNDGTLAHTVERLFVLSANKKGFRAAIIRDRNFPSWSPWRFDQQHFGRSIDFIVEYINSKNIKLIIFDVFDTLLVRPLLNAESIKRIIARRVPPEVGQLFLQYRLEAENLARIDKKRDVELHEIYTYLQKLTRLSKEEIQYLQNIEVIVERNSVGLREEAAKLLSLLSKNNNIVLSSDMFLPLDIIRDILDEHDIHGYTNIFVSSSTGIRKDTGEFYKYILKEYSLEPSDIAVVGDNERSDAQIPGDMGMLPIHVLRPVEIARGHPRWAALIHRFERLDDLDSELSLGLLLRKHFSALQFINFDPHQFVPLTPYNWGYTLVGPLLVGFAQWLLEVSRRDGIQKLYFLSREGQIIKSIFDCWTEDLSGPSSEYLIVSRRAVTVAGISNFEDILEIAKPDFFGASLGHFLLYRYGIDLAKVSHLVNLNDEVNIKFNKFNNPSRLVDILRCVEPFIIEQALNERQGLVRYLYEKGLDEIDLKVAVVDIGYGGTIQLYLNKILGREIGGYYIITDNRIERVSEKHNLLARGWLYENIFMTSPNIPLIAKLSFYVEKLLSACEAQVAYYKLDDDGRPVPVYQEQTEVELAANEIRREVHRGALDYALDAQRVRRTLLPDFRPSRELPEAIWESFLSQMSAQETALMDKIVLDDRYCGRGIV